MTTPALQPAPTLSAPAHTDATAIHAVPARLRPWGFEVLVLREFRPADAPPAFARIEQHLLRAPERLNRHGVSFALALRPEIVSALTGLVGRPSQRDAADRPIRNPLWPALTWQARPYDWPDGTRTTEWWAQARFPTFAPWDALRRQFAPALAGHGAPCPSPSPEPQP
ncbi:MULTISPECIES: hypothetical protein [unclassified Xanthobacter]|uniref:hypothetical protein n=1 Tax=unclassified Xanthobacter TaxID=2623496 RepID=UPI001EDE7175|nr:MULTISPECIES: hypothetical protein [unclassified Xanthobacter]